MTRPASFTILVTAEDGTRDRHLFDLGEVTIGRTPDNHIALPVAVISKRHARIVRKDDRYILVDLKSMNGTYLNGRKITAPLLVKPGDRIVMGTFVLELVLDDLEEARDTVDHHDEDPTIDRSPQVPPPVPPPPLGRDPVETQLLAAIDARDDASRIVYADWLEQRGESTRAEFLRIQQELIALAPDHPRFAPRTARLRELAATLDVAWRFAVARPAIERCDVKFDFSAEEWGA